jgi:hypothetical protein
MLYNCGILMEDEFVAVAFIEDQQAVTGRVECVAVTTKVFVRLTAAVSVRELP